MKTLTPKQERFCQEIVIGQTLSAAFEVAFTPKTMSKKTVNERACRLARQGKIRARITELRAPIVAQVQETMANRLAELAYAIDFSRLTDEELREHVRIRNKALILTQTPDHLSLACALVGGGPF